jgi:hypothetical protein
MCKADNQGEACKLQQAVAVTLATKYDQHNKHTCSLLVQLRKGLG